MEELRHSGGVAAFRIKLGKGENRFDHEAPLPRRFGLRGRYMKVLTPQAPLVASDPEQPLERLHHGRLAGAVHPD